MVRPAARKEVVGHLQSIYGISQRRACRLVPISRKALGYVSNRTVKDAELVNRLKALAERYPRYGYLMLHELLRREGLVVNRKRTYRIYTALHLAGAHQKAQEAHPAQGAHSRAIPDKPALVSRLCA